jgi:hypothetical protein
MARAWLFSSLLHVALVALLYFGLPSLHRPSPPIEQAVTVELVNQAPEAERKPPAPAPAATAPAPEQRAASPKPPPEPKVEPKPAPAPQQAEKPPEPRPEPPPPPPAIHPEPPKPELAELQPKPTQPEPKPAPPPPPPAVKPAPEPEPAPTPEIAKPEPAPPPPAVQPKSVPPPVPPEVQPKPEPPPVPRPEIAKPQLEPKPAPKPEPPPPAPPPSPKPQAKPAPPQVAQATPPPAVKPAPAQEDPFAALLKSVEQLDRHVQGDNPQTGQGRVAVADGKARSALGEAQLSFSEIDALRRQIGSCWTLPVGIEGIDDMIVQLRIEVRPDRTVQSVAIEDQARLGRDPTFRAVAESARRAVDRCSPLTLPPGKYALWRDIHLNFRPQDAING